MLALHQKKILNRWNKFFSYLRLLHETSSIEKPFQAYCSGQMKVALVRALSLYGFLVKTEMPV